MLYRQSTSVVLLGLCVLLQEISEGEASNMPQLSNSASIIILTIITAVYFSITAACTVVICRIMWKRSKSNRMSPRQEASHQSYELTDMKDRRGIADRTDLVASGRAGVWRKLVDEQLHVLPVANGTGPHYNGARHAQPTEPQEQHSLPAISKARAKQTKQPPVQSSADAGSRLASSPSFILMHSPSSKETEQDDVFDGVADEGRDGAKKSCLRGQEGKKQFTGKTAKFKARESKSPSPSEEALRKKKVKSRTNSTKPLLEATDSWEMGFTESNTNLMDDVLTSLNLPSDSPQHPFSDTSSKTNEARQACGSESNTTPQPVSGSDAGTAPRPAHTSHDVFDTQGLPNSGTNFNSLPRRSSSGTAPRQVITSGFGTMPRASHPKLRRSSTSSSGPKVLVSPIASTSYRSVNREKSRGVNRAASVSAIPEHHSLSTKVEVEQNYYTLETRVGGGVGRRVTSCTQQPGTRRPVLETQIRIEFDEDGKQISGL